MELTYTTWSLAAGYFPAEYLTLSRPAVWVLGVVRIPCRSRVGLIL
jgi:hypothetical protein